MTTPKLLPIIPGSFRISQLQRGVRIGPRLVDGWICDGKIGIRPDPEIADCWELTLISTGMLIGTYIGPKREAWRVARDLAPLFTDLGSWETPPPQETLRGVQQYVWALCNAGRMMR